MRAKPKPMMTIVNEKPVVTRAIVVECGRIAWERRPPVDDATIRVTTGSSHTAVILCIEWSWRTILDVDVSSPYSAQSAGRSADLHGVEHAECDSIRYGGVEPPETPEGPEETFAAEAPILVDVLRKR